MFNQSNNNNNVRNLISQSNNNYFPNIKKSNTHSLKSTSSSNSFDSFFIEHKKIDLNLQKNKTYNKNENNELNTFINNDMSFHSFYSFKNSINKKNENLNYEKANNVLNELNTQIINMNYCNIIQSNSIRRLDLSLSFLSSQINTLKFLNKKRKINLQKSIEKMKQVGINNLK